MDNECFRCDPTRALAAPSPTPADPPFEGEPGPRNADLLLVRLRSVLRLLVTTLVGNVVLAALAGAAFAFVVQGREAVTFATRPVAAVLSRPAEQPPSR